MDGLSQMGGWGCDVRNGMLKISQWCLYSKRILHNHQDERMLERNFAHGAIKMSWSFVP